MIRIIALTDSGLTLANRLANLLGNEARVMFKPKPFSAEVHAAFLGGETLIFIAAMGIVFRTLAPVLKNKKTDPAVVVLDEQGRFVVPVLSGHEGGANEFARQIATLLAAELVLTTANAYLKPIYTVGMGCERHCPTSELKGLLDRCLSQVNLSLEQIESVNSIDLKADEVGLIDLATQLQKPFITWSPEQLRAVEKQLSSRSDYVFNLVGVYGVAESAALYCAQRKTGNPAELMLTKQKTQKATCAIARSYPSLEDDRDSVAS